MAKQQLASGVKESEAGMEGWFPRWRVKLSSVRRLGAHALLAGVALFALQTVPWLLCVYQWSNALEYDEEGIVPDKYICACGPTPGVAMPAILAVLAGTGAAVVWDGISDRRASRQLRGEGTLWQNH